MSSFNLTPEISIDPVETTRRGRLTPPKIIPHFEQVPLKSSKQKDFILFARICRKMKNSKHLTIEGFRKIIQLAYQMNGSGKRKYSEVDMLKNLFEMKI